MSALSTRSIFLIISFSLVLMNKGYGKSLIGRWCDRTLPGTPQFNRIIQLYVGDKKEIILSSQFNDGSSMINEMKLIKTNIYEEIGSASMDSVTITADGKLEMFDIDGFIRVAIRLEAHPSKDECSR